MGGQESRIVGPKANVVNEVIITHNNADLLSIEICLYIITAVISLNLLAKVYFQHNKNLKKNTLAKQTI